VPAVGRAGVLPLARQQVAHALGIGGHGHDDYPGKETEQQDPAHLEEQKAKGAIKTDFILSAEIMTISLAAIPPSNFWMEAATLAAVAIMITVLVYGAVALIVKADDLGLMMAAKGQLGLTRSLGRGIVKAMPGLMKALTVIGTAAMLWVGGNIVVHGMEVLGAGWLYDTIHHAAEGVAHALPENFAGFGKWAVTATLDGIFGVALGLALIPVGEKIITPLWRAVFVRKTA
jgi:predicted DNA repair protein MutK